MRKLATLLIALGLLVACAASVQEQRATLERAAGMLGAADVKTLEYTGSGVQYQSGQSQTPGDRWPQFNVPSFTRVMSYETASMQDTMVRTQGENPPRGGGVQPIRGEQRQVFFLSGEHAWNQVGDAAVPAPIALADRQLQLWTTPHGFIRAALGAQRHRERAHRVLRGARPLHRAWHPQRRGARGEGRGGAAEPGRSATCRSRSPTPTTNSSAR
jgi:hypothetical protein